jgi:hypothetical protein
MKTVKVSGRQNLGERCRSRNMFKMFILKDAKTHILLLSSK